MSFEIDNDELYGIDPEKAFVLGYELSQLTNLIEKERPDGFMCHLENLERVLTLLEGRYRYKVEALDDTWTRVELFPLKLHPNNMSRDELRELVGAMSYAALDLGQHLKFTNDALKIQYRKEAFHRATQMAYDISYMPYEDELPKQSNFEIAFFGAKGLITDFDEIDEYVRDPDSNLPSRGLGGEPVDYTEFERAFVELESLLISPDEIEDGEKRLHHWRRVTEDCTQKQSISMKAKTLRKILWRYEYILNLAKAANDLYLLVRGELDKLND